MPTERERQYYRDGYSDGFRDGRGGERFAGVYAPEYGSPTPKAFSQVTALPKNKKRKLSAWNKYVKANSKKPRFRLRSGSPNLKKLGVAFRKTPAGKKKRR